MSADTGRMPADTIIEVRDLVKRFGKAVVHDHLNLDVYRGEVLSIVGGSGTGKTVLLRQIVGLERPTSGTIRLFGEDATRLGARERQSMRNRWGMQFQRGALFSALSVLDNIALPLRELRCLPDNLICEASLLKLELVGLSAKDADKMPADLSGGMVKRVALARALALEPELVFLDEPTAGLDPMASDDYVALIRDLRRELGLTVVMVTHDLDTLVALSDRVAVLADRKVLAALPLPQLVKVDHPFIHEYFLGERGQRALQALPSPASPMPGDGQSGEM
ncbi:ABC transporter ATP-binding protein [Cupriavidus respiraculi]|uniref:Intermembrane phospholipid transport system ATP-binding protein MlaF n=1 Tax=Cupriavidus respiraculi TaxID=195930 RepID=A0ABN7Z7Z0_9BURK|nr:ABC transporter ATP-binding protein [Cupriavidus respiraculi]MBY4946371.1 ABC transporter ATP-binding protein [Cupriavidus respiraculi]CAG9182000.1 Intermembrane phospholipid transport system ATP-binding protein MlaF [Cupriavidus respiraculi]